MPVMCEAADKWRKMKEETLEQFTFSLKLAVFKQLLMSLHQRLTETTKDGAAMERAAALNWVDDQKSWRHLQRKHRTTEAGDRQHLAASSDGGPVDPAGADAQGGDRGLPPAVQVGEEAGDGGHCRVDTVPDMHLATPGKRCHLEHTEPVDRPSIVAHPRVSIATRSPGVRQSGPRSVATPDADVGMKPSLKALLA